MRKKIPTKAKFDSSLVFFCMYIYVNKRKFN